MTLLSALSRFVSFSLIASVICLVLIVTPHSSNAFTLYDAPLLDGTERPLHAVNKRVFLDEMLKRGECGCGFGCFYSSARGCAACCSLGL
uniref:Secreted protein n=1 Tax=Ascaris lumbricoides TaxID=6252 RepID=A0A0M3I576_ASCLU